MENFKTALKLIFASKRAFSFYWRAGVGLGLLFTSHLTGILPELNLPVYFTVVIGYALNEATKALNNYANYK